MNMYFVYILRCGDGTLYTGITNDLERRLGEHRKGVGGRYTRSKTGIRLVYSESVASRSAALKREAQIKNWRRAKKLNLVNNRAV